MRNYYCDSCNIKLSISGKSQGWFTVLVEIILIPIVIGLAIIFFNIWVAVGLFILIVFCIRALVYHFNIKKRI